MSPDFPGSGRHFVAARHLAFGEKFSSLREIGSHKSRKWHQAALKRLERILAQEPVAALCHHNGINHYPAGRIFFELESNRLNDLSIVEHPDLDGVDSQVGKHRLEFRLNERCRNRHDARNAPRILRGKRCGSPRGIGAQRTHRLLVGEQSGSA